MSEMLTKSVIITTRTSTNQVKELIKIVLKTLMMMISHNKTLTNFKFSKHGF